jgi:hypothetical protein
LNRKITRRMYFMLQRYIGLQDSIPVFPGEPKTHGKRYAVTHGITLPMGFFFPHRAGTQNRWVLPSCTVREPKTDGFWSAAPTGFTLGYYTPIS